MTPDRPSYIHTPARRFELHRDADETGVSGTGVVASGLCWADGRAALRALHAALTDAHDDPREVSSSAPSSGIGAPRPSRGAGGATQSSGISGWFAGPGLAVLSAVIPLGFERPRANWSPVAFIRRSWLALAFLSVSAGCAPHTPPVYSLALPPARSEPAPPALSPAPTDAPPFTAVLAGEVVTGDGVLLSPVEYALVTWEAGVLAPWLREQWRLERIGREGDRAAAEARAALDGEDLRALRREARIRTWAALGLGAAGLLVGAGIGIAASSAAEVMP